MRWSALFDDLEAQVAVLAEAGRPAEIADRARAEVGDIRFADRLRSASGPVRVRLRDGGVLRGRVRSAGADWLLLADEAGDEVLVLASGMCSAAGLGRSARAPDGMIARRLTVRSALRGLALDRATVLVTLVDGTSLPGTIDRVGADFLDLAVHAADGARRRAEVRESTTILLSALASIRRRS